MSVRLSHSSQEKYQECPEKWRLHYEEKLRSIYLGSPLFFGNALDAGFSRILLEKKNEKNTTIEEKTLLLSTEQEVFKNSLSTTYYNKKNIYLPDYEHASYSKKDYDYDLLESDDIEAIADKAKALDLEVTTSNIDEFIEHCRLEFKREGVHPDEQKLYNYVHWLSLYRKGLILLEAYRIEVLPKLKEVFSIQEKVELLDGEDVFTGFIDFEAEWLDEPNVIYTCDNKTSSKAYPQDAVQKTQQLCFYTEFKNTNRGCYVVVEKGLRKKHPRYRIQILKGIIPEESYDIAFSNVEEVYQAIKARKFDRKEDQKECYAYGKKCDYYKYCWNEGDMTGLVDLKDKDV